MSDIRFHIDEEGEQVIAERDGRAVGVLPWVANGTAVQLGRIGSPVVVAAHERRKGVLTGMANLARERFPRSEGYVISTTPAISNSLRSVLAKPSMKKNTKAWLDEIGEGEASEVSTPEAQRLLNLAQPRLDSLLSK